MLKALIVEDEKAAAESLQNMLAESAEIVVQGVASTLTKARSMLAIERPDVLFLDIMIEGENLLHTIRDFVPLSVPIIITTAYEEYALKSVDVGIVAYLLKPLEQRRLNEAIDRASTAITMRPPISPNRFLVKAVGCWHIIEINDLVRAEANKGYTVLFLASGQQVLLSKTIGEVSLQLSESSGFVRCHKSHLINIRYVAEIRTGRTPSLRLTTEETIPLAQRRKDQILQLFAQLPTF